MISVRAIDHLVGKTLIYRHSATALRASDRASSPAHPAGTKPLHMRKTRHMAYDEDLADRLRVALSGEPVAEKKMFGGLAFLVNGHMTVAASGQGGILARVDPDDGDALLDQPGIEEMRMGGRAGMRGWLRVDAEVVDDDAALRQWVTRSLAYVRTLPPK
jgi:TfoX/Sxy family transcriptional regulator of competence genes